MVRTSHLQCCIQTHSGARPLQSLHVHVCLCGQADCLYSHKNRGASRTRRREKNGLIILCHDLWVHIDKNSQSSHCRLPSLFNFLTCGFSVLCFESIWPTLVFNAGFPGVYVHVLTLLLSQGSPTSPRVWQSLKMNLTGTFFKLLLDEIILWAFKLSIMFLLIR